MGGRSVRSARAAGTMADKDRIGDRGLGDMVLCLRYVIGFACAKRPGRGYDLVAGNDRGRLRLARA